MKKIILLLFCLVFSLNAFSSFWYKADADYQRRKRMETEKKNRELEEKLRNQQNNTKPPEEVKDDFHEFVDNFTVEIKELTNIEDKKNHKRRFELQLTGPDPITDFKITIVDINENPIIKVKPNSHKQYIFSINEKRENIKVLMEYKDRKYSYYDFVQDLTI